MDLLIENLLTYVQPVDDALSVRGDRVRVGVGQGKGEVVETNSAHVWKIREIIVL